jgi:hypothetical protein
VDRKGPNQPRPRPRQARSLRPKIVVIGPRGLGRLSNRKLRRHSSHRALGKSPKSRSRRIMKTDGRISSALPGHVPVLKFTDHHSNVNLVHGLLLPG